MKWEEREKLFDGIREWASNECTEAGESLVKIINLYVDDALDCIESGHDLQDRLKISLKELVAWYDGFKIDIDPDNEWLDKWHERYDHLLEKL